MLKRGAYDAPGERCPGLPAVLPAMPGSLPNNRLGLARWLVDRVEPAHRARDGEPLLADVLRHGLGEDSGGLRLAGRVARASRNSSTGWPSRFMDSGWDVKALLKTIVMSATYRQSSKVTPDAAGERPGKPPAGSRPALPPAC